MKVRTIAVAVALAGAAATAVAVTATDSRPELRLPAASAFPDGTCRDAADAVLALGRFTYEHDGAKGLPAAAYPFLRQRAGELAEVRKAAVTPPEAADAERVGPGGGPTRAGRSRGPAAVPHPAEQALSARLDAVLTAIGFLRIRPGKAYDPRLLRDLETARADLQQTCVRLA